MSILSIIFFLIDDSKADSDDESINLVLELEDESSNDSWIQLFDKYDIDELVFQIIGDLN